MVLAVLVTVEGTAPSRIICRLLCIYEPRLQQLPTQLKSLKVSMPLAEVVSVLVRLCAESFRLSPQMEANQCCATNLNNQATDK
jgi:hypothetical protein